MLDILTCVGNGEISKRSEQCSKYNIAHKNLPKLETIVNNELAQIHTWLCANKLSLNIDKSNFVYIILLKYLGITLDKKSQLEKTYSINLEENKKKYRYSNKNRYYVNLEILINLYYSIVYPLLTYCLVTWSNT